MSSPTLAIVMPAYNESACIEPVVRQWMTVFEKVPGTLIVVNDGSKDDTGSILDRLVVSNPGLRVVHQKNAGHGAAVLRGYREALATGAHYVFQTDSDDQFTPSDFWGLWEKRSLSPFIIGFRQARSDAFHRLIITKIVIFLNFLLFGVFLKDSNIPYRLMRAEYLQQLLTLFPSDVFAPNIFLTVIAAKSGANLFEIPIQHMERKTGSVSIIKWKLIKVCLRCVKELTLFRWSLVQRRSDIKALKARYV